MAASLALTEPSAGPASPRRLIRRSIAVAAAAAMVWALGLGWFLYLASQSPPPLRRTDAIVALTGGPDRVEVALKLLANGAAGKLLISGAGEKTDLGALAHLAGIDAAPLEQQVTLGHAAHSTRGNASETASWAHEHDIGSLLVVTAWFHMPRAMIELRRAMPAVTAYPYPIGHLSVAELSHGGMARRVIGEYHKYLAALAGFTAWPFAIETWGTESAG
jgi:uncharacterized SAM-binding protein YcdF (DUF218 family)